MHQNKKQQAGERVECPVEVKAVGGVEGIDHFNKTVIQYESKGVKQEMKKQIYSPTALLEVWLTQHLVPAKTSAQSKRNTRLGLGKTRSLVLMKTICCRYQMRFWAKD